MSEATSSIREQTLTSFLDALGSKQPVPGGGAVAGMTTAVAASLGEMVVAYSLGKKSLSDEQPMLEEAAARLHELRREALDGADRDAAAYAGLNELWGLDKDDPRRRDGWTAAVTGAIDAPGAIMQTAHEVLGILEKLPGHSAKHLASDLAIAVELASTGGRSAERNVAVNLPFLEDEQLRASLDSRYGTLGEEIHERARHILEQLA